MRGKQTYLLEDPLLHEHGKVGEEISVLVFPGAIVHLDVEHLRA